MTKFEKVTKGLEQHMGTGCLSEKEQLQPVVCPYFHNSNCIIALCRDALELLKEQEPHVLTLEEAEKSEYCVLEVRDGSLLQVVHDEDGGYFSPDLNNSENLYFEKLLNEDEHDDYNRHIRCWSSLPSKEQRQEAKWND